MHLNASVCGLYAVHSMRQKDSLRDKTPLAAAAAAVAAAGAAAIAAAAIAAAAAAAAAAAIATLIVELFHL